MMRCEQSKVSVDYVLNIRLQSRISHRGADVPPQAGEDKADKAISSIGVNVAGDVDMEAMQEWIGALLRKRRVTCTYERHPCRRSVKQRYVYHAVHMVVQGEFMEPWGERRARLQIDLHRQGSDHDALIAGMNECMATPENKQKRMTSCRHRPCHVQHRRRLVVVWSWLTFIERLALSARPCLPDQARRRRRAHLLARRRRSLRPQGVTCVASSGGLDAVGPDEATTTTTT